MRRFYPLLRVLFVLTLVSAAWWWMGERRNVSPVGFPSSAPGAAMASGQEAAVDPGARPASIGAAPASASIEPKTNRAPSFAALARLTYAQGWSGEMPDALAPFRDWTERYLRATTLAERSALEFEGLERARLRRVAMKQLIERDPRAALACTVPAAVRSQLPAEVVAELETRFSVVGDFSVVVIDYGPMELIRRKQRGLSTEPLQQFVQWDGGTKYRAYVYGRREGQTTKAGIPMHGVLLDGVAALHEAAVRALDPGESLPAGWSPTDIGFSNNAAGVGTATLAEIGGKFYRFTTPESVVAAERKLAAAEAGIGPQQIPPVDSILAMVPESDAALLPTGNMPATAWTVGNKNVIIIRVDFPDMPGDPRFGSTVCTASYVQNLADTQVSPYYLQSSFGATTLTNTATPQLYRMPQTAVSYAVGGLHSQLHIDARAAAAAHYTLANYDRIFVLFTNLSGIVGSQITYGGIAELGGPYIWINGEFNFRLVAHELGHTYGLLHANLWQVTDGNPVSAAGTSTEYGDPFDTMGNNWSNDLRTDFNPWFKNLLGWVADSQVQTITGSGTYRVNRFDNSTGTGTLALKVTRDGTRNYWIGARRSFTTNASMQHGAYVIWGYNSNQPSNLIDLTTPGTNSSDAALALSMTHLDTVGNVSIKAVSEGGSAPNEYLDVEVNVGLNGRPMISVHPQSHGFSVGDTITLSVTATGTPPMAYQWRKNGSDISAATGVTYTITNAPASAAGSYTVQVSNPISTIVSNAAVLEVNSIPVITTQPVNILTMVGSNVTFSVGATGIPPPGYQWRKYGSPLSGGTGAAYSFNGPQLGDAGNYDVVVSNSLGAVTSETVSLTVNPYSSPPSNDHFSNAWNLSVNAGIARGHSVGASGETGEPTHVNANGTASSVWYRWTPSVSGIAQVDTINSSFNTVLAVYTGSTLTGLNKIGEDDQGGGNNTSKLVFPVVAGTTYNIAVGDSTTSHLGGNITLNYKAIAPPIITTQPVSAVATLGGSASFSVGAAGSGLAYQWYRNSAALSGATGATLYLVNVQDVDVGSYYVVVSNFAGSSTSVTVTLSGSAAPPTITAQPASLLVTAGQSASFNVSATASGPLSYQWLRNGFVLPGATNPSHVIANASRTDADSYSVRVSSGLSFTTSQVARLSVAPTSYPAWVAPNPAWDLQPELSSRASGFAVASLADGRAYLAGNISSVAGVRRTGIVRVSADGILDAGFAPPEIDNLIQTVAVQGDGKVLIGGSFVRVNGALRNRIARLNADGSVDASFNVGLGASGTVQAIAVQGDGRILVGGSFASFAGSTRNYLVRLNVDGSIDNGFLNLGVNSTVNAISLQPDGRIVVGGSLTAFVDATGASTSRTRVARLNPDGTLDSTFAPAPNSTIYALSLQPDGKVVIGGAFSAVGATTVGRIARLNGDGSLDTAFSTGTGTGFSSTVNALAVQADGRILVGGSFYSFGGATHNFFVRLNSDGTRDASFLTKGFSNGISAIVVQASGRIIVGGYFFSYWDSGGIGTSRKAFARLNPDGTLDSGINLSVRGAGTILGLSPLPGGKTLVTGDFDLMRNSVCPFGIARINADGTVDSGFNSGGAGGDLTIRSAAPQPDGRIVIAGFLRSYNGTAFNGVGRLNADGTPDASFNAAGALNGGSYTVSLLPGGRILVGGIFSTARGVTRNRVAVFQSDGSLDGSFDPGTGANSEVYTSVVQPDGKVILGGVFSSYSGTMVGRIVRVLPSGAIDASFNPGTGANSIVNALALQSDGKLLVAGSFGSFNGLSRSGIARLHPDGSVDAGFVPPAIGSVYSVMAQEDGRVVLRGSFTSVGGAAGTAYLARLNADGSRDATFTAGGLSGSVMYGTALVMRDNGQILTRSDGVVGIVATQAASLPAIASQPVGQTVTPGATVNLSVTASGSALPLTYQWLFNGSPISGATTSSLVLANAQPAASGNYTVVVASELGTTTSAAAVVTVVERGMLVGSVRTDSGHGAASLRAAFTVEGTASKQMLVRAIGPALATFGVSGAMPDPRLEILAARTRVLVGSNDNWDTAANAAQVATVSAQVGAFALSAGSKDSAVLGTYAPGTYQVRVSDVTGGTGAVLLEIFDADSVPRLVYLATRAMVGGAGGNLIAGIGISNAPPGRSYLVRALGPALNSFEALADPQLTVTSGNGGSVLATNDNWGGDATLASIGNSVGAMPLPPASKDAVVNFVPPGGGTYIAQVSGVGGTSGVALLEVFEVDADRSSAIPVAVASPPDPVTVLAGAPAPFGVVTVGRPAPVYQWRKNMVPIAGATNSMFTIPAVQVTDAGTYVLHAMSVSGNATSSSAVLTVPVAGDYYGAQSVLGGGYVAGSTVTLSNTITYPGVASQLSWSATIPSGWTYVSSGISAGEIRPGTGAVGQLNWIWLNVPVSPVTFTYTLNVPAGETVARSIAASAGASLANGSPIAVAVTPAPLTMNLTTRHSGDTDGNWQIDILDLMRMIELYNTRNGTTRTGAYAVATSTTIDAFASDPARPAGTSVSLSRYHSADYSHGGQIDILELMRVIELYNYRNGTTRTGQYHAQAGTADGFAPGP